MKRAIKQARAGNEAARRFVYEYVVGKPKPMSTHATIKLGGLATSAECATAAASIAAAAARGDVGLDEARVLADLIEGAGTAHRVAELEASLETLQQQLREDQGLGRWR